MTTLALMQIASVALSCAYNQILAEKAKGAISIMWPISPA
jgi:hypothetical protein